MTYYDKNALKLSHLLMKERIKCGDTVVDATAGKGRDTLLLSRLAGDIGKVFAFDIQAEAIEITRNLLFEHGRKNVTLICDSHHNICRYVSEAAGVIFNFGFLPGSDHKIFSSPDTSIKAIEAALSIIKEDGFVSLCIYYGKDTGYEERDALLSFFQSLDDRKYTVMLQSFYNRQNCPPLFAVIEKNR